MSAGPLTFGPGIVIEAGGVQAGPNVIIVDYEYLTTENGDFLITEAGELLVTEQ
jgi:hypothetical protein